MTGCDGWGTHVEPMDEGDRPADPLRRAARRSRAAPSRSVLPARSRSAPARCAPCRARARRGQGPEHPRDLRPADRHHHRPGERARSCSRSRAIASPSGQMTLAAGALVSYRGGKRFAYRNGASRLTLGHGRGGYRLAADLDGFDLAALDLAHPPRFMKQILKIGDDCFSSVLACTRQGERRRVQARAQRRCSPDASSARGTCRSPGTMLTLIDDARLETRLGLRPGGRPLRLSAAAPGHLPAARAADRLRGRGADRRRARQGPRHTRRRSRWSPTANTNDQLPASAWFSLLLDKWPDPKIRGDFTLSCGNCHQIARLPLPARQDRGAVAQRPHAHDDEPAAVLSGDARPARSRT